MLIKIFQCPICRQTFSKENYGEAAETWARDCEARGSTPYLFGIGEKVVVPLTDGVVGSVVSRSRSHRDHGNYYDIHWLEGPRIGAADLRRWQSGTFSDGVLLKFNPQKATDVAAETSATASAAQS